jgi:competence protein ComEA
MKQIIRDYLTFNKRERNGVFVLVTIIVILLVYLNISERFITTEINDLSKFTKQMDSLNLFLEANTEIEQPEIREGSLPVQKTFAQRVERFKFDPNDLSVEDWKRLGLLEKQIGTIKKYQAKGGKFRKKEDLKKMYCIKEELYTSLEPYIQIQSANATFENGQVRTNVNATSLNEPTKAVSPSLKIAGIVELNSADSAMLTTIKGIGAFYAKAIIKYRNSLGGFHSKEQLLEVWKFDQEKLSSIEKYISIDLSKVRKININTCTSEQLKIPYVKWNVANAIVNYRKQHGTFKTIEDIKNTDLVDDELLRKIAPYLIAD